MYEWINSNKFLPRLTRHLVFWVTIVLFFVVLYGSFNDKYWHQLQLQLLFLPDKVIPTYFALYFLMPRFLLREKYTQFFGGLVVILLLSGWLHWTLQYFIEQPIYYPGEYWGPYLYPAKILKATTYVYPYVLVAFLIKFLKHWYEQQQVTAELAKGRLETELKLLRTQLHPHFLFNTLNNLYALTLKKSDKAPELVLKLSELMDYMLYECGDTERVPLDREVQFVKNYFEIERLRYGDRLDIKSHFSSHSSDLMIAPLIFLPFLENAFKHGVSADLEDVWIDLDLRVEGNELQFRIRNSKPPGPTTNGNGNGNGIGLKNLRRRLELQYGEGSHELTTSSTADTYEAHLRLTL